MDLSNSQLIVRDMIEQEFGEQSEYPDKGAFFEYIVASKLMSSYDLDNDEVTAGLTGGPQDGGCDAIYIFCNDLLLNEDSDLVKSIQRNAKVEIFIIQTKFEKSFKEDAFLRWKDLCNDLLVFGNDLAGFSSKYTVSILSFFRTIRSIIKICARKGATATARFVYVANAPEASDGVKRQASGLKTAAEKVVGSSYFNADTVLIGAQELLRRWNPPSEASLMLRFANSYSIVPQRSDCIGLVTLSDYYNFLVNEEGKLRSYLFEANIRDYEGNVAVNKAIRATLENPGHEDFWWLNNGVTILATEVTQAAGGEFKLVEPRIVNGLQTTYEIYSYMDARESENPDSRNVLVRIIVPDSDETRSKVIMATNSQTNVKKTSLRATDPIHLQIELYLKSKGLYYERRKNYYKNQGKKPEEIISISFLAQCLMSTILMSPNQARARPSTLLADDSKYEKLFDSKANIEAFYRVARLGKTIVLRLSKVKPNYTRAQVTDLRFYVLMGVAQRINRKLQLSFNDLASMDVELANNELIGEVADAAMAVYERFGGNSNVAKSAQLPSEVAKAVSLADNMYAEQ
ncbi:AIPR family protein [Olsenella umbonata]|uniref:AIPR family protein n=2 Tax=Parafannyhessea umbonata TaxID=604330 RepID=A0A6N7WWZ9_9ACTN|nr:AIPR family protein [Parafannyhessea umbonata]